TENSNKQEPERPCLDLIKLRSVLCAQSENVFEALVTELCANDFVRKGSGIARISHQPMLPAKLQPVERKIREALSQKPFDPPPRREIEVDRGSQHVLRFLIERDEVIELGSDAILLRKNFELMRARIIDFISK